MGTFEIPGSVILDKAFLKTLDNRNIVNGIGEILKLAVIPIYIKTDLQFGGFVIGIIIALQYLTTLLSRSFSGAYVFYQKDGV